MSLEDRGYMQRPPGASSSGLPRFSAFQIIFGLNIAMFVVQQVFGFGLVDVPNTNYRTLWGGVSLDELSRGHFWTLFTYMFVHGSVGHILMNMVLLWFAGRKIQQLFGGRHFVQIYFVSGLLGAAIELAINAYSRGDTFTPLVGASASVFGLLTALAVALPDEEVTALIYFVIPVRMRLSSLTLGLVVLNVLLGLGGLFFPSLMSGLQIAYFAHVGGALAGWYYTRALGYDGSPVAKRLAEMRQPQRIQRAKVMARTRKNAPVIDLEIDVEAAARENERRTPKSNLMEDVDPILDKINDFGIQSLSAEERRILDRACREFQDAKDDR